MSEAPAPSEGGPSGASNQAPDAILDLLEHGRHAEALAMAESTVDLDPDDGESWHLLGRAHEALLNRKQAVLAHREATRRDPDRSGWHFRLGLAYERLGNAHAAMASYGDATAVPGSPPRHWFYLGRAAEKVGDVSRATYAYQRYHTATERRHRASLDLHGGLLPYETAIRFGAVDRPQYGYALYRACLLAERLGVDEISAVELGVSNGRGLLALEAHAEVCTSLTGVRLSLYGLDTGTGLPDPVDHRDLAHFFHAGDYAMNAAPLTEGMTSARLVLGDAGETVPELLASGIPPVGALLFDMDLYSSTARVLASLGDDAEESWFLPRISVHFDDIIPKRPRDWLKDFSDVTGESLAIDEFNADNARTHLSRDRYFLGVPEYHPWHNCAYLLHRLHHPSYTDPVKECRCSPRQVLPNAECGVRNAERTDGVRVRGSGFRAAECGMRHERIPSAVSDQRSLNVDC